MTSTAERATRLRAVTRRPSTRRSWWIDFAIWSAIGLVWALGNPLMAAPDEPAHAIKAAAVANGDLSTDSTEAPFGWQTAPMASVEVPAAYAALNGRLRCFGSPTRAPLPCLDDLPIGTDRSTLTGATYVGAYQPLYYAMVGWPSRLVAPETALRLMRVVTVLICSALLASGFASARQVSHRRNLVLLSGLAITPMAVFLFASINPNGVEIAAAFCVGLTLLAALREPDVPGTRLLVRLAIAGVLLAFARPISPFILIGVAVAMLALAASRETLGRLSRDRRVQAAVSVVLVAAIVSVVFVTVNHSASALIAGPPSTDGGLAQFSNALSSTGRWSEQMIGVLGWIGFAEPRLPAALVVGWLAAVLIVTGAALLVGTWRQRVVLTGLVASVILLPPLAMAVTDSRYGWQGRYILPVAVCVPIAGGWILDRRTTEVDATLSIRKALVALVSTGIGITYTVALVTTIGYDLLGTNRLRPVLDAPWTGPLTELVLYALAFVTAAAWAARLAWSTWPRAAGETSSSPVVRSARW